MPHCFNGAGAGWLRKMLVLDRKLEVDPCLQECQLEALFPWNPDRAKIMSATRQERKANYIFEKWLVGGTVGR